MPRIVVLVGMIASGKSTYAQKTKGDLMHECPSYVATINCGLKDGYAGPLSAVGDAVAICRKYCDEIGLGLTVTPTTFVYTGGCEPGVIVGLINYPRYPLGGEAVERMAMELAGRLKEELKQQRVSVVLPNRTVMLGDL